MIYALVKRVKLYIKIYIYIYIYIYVCTFMICLMSMMESANLRLESNELDTDPLPLSY
jgi:hypothetical protein